MIVVARNVVIRVRGIILLLFFVSYDSATVF
jgi:hypothetical protein